MQTRTENGPQCLNRDVIKYAAMVTMLMNHIAHTLLSDPYGSLAIVFEDIGYFTAPIMCYFLVEGFFYTHSRKNYGIRLFAFSMISVVPYYLAFGANRMNMIWTLFLCFLILMVLHQDSLWPEIRLLCAAGLTVFTLLSDWGIFAPVMVILFDRAFGNRKKTLASFAVSAALYGTYCVNVYYTLAQNIYGYTGGRAVSFGIVQGILAALPVLLAGLVICFLYSGKKMQVKSKGAKAFNRWFFYTFYPAHLLVLYLLSRTVVS